MSDSPRRKAIVGRTVMIGGAILIGLVAGSWKQIIALMIDNPDTAMRGTAAESVLSAVGVVEEAAELSGPGSVSISVPPAPETIYASDGLTFQPAFNASAFIGYQVMTGSSDERFSDGDIVVAINGERLADLDDNSEYFLALLANESAVLEIERKKPVVQE